jgi:hypothetical protein
MDTSNRTNLQLDHHKDFTYKNLVAMTAVATERAMEYLHGTYDIDDEMQAYLDSYMITFTRRNGSRHSGHNLRIKISINDRPWHTYDRKTIGKVANGIKIPRLLRTTMSVIHEYTHAIQRWRWLQNNKQGQRAGELETTKNEIHYVSLVSPSTIDKMELC